MDTNQPSDTFQKVQTSLREIKNKLIDLSKDDLTNLHVHHDWSWVPYLQDHLEFLAEQVAGVEHSLRDAPPPVSPEDLENMKTKSSNEQK